MDTNSFIQEASGLYRFNACLQNPGANSYAYYAYDKSNWTVSYEPTYAYLTQEPTNESLYATSGIPSLQWIDELYQKSDMDILDKIKQACQNSLNDVKTTIAKAKTLSAFISIFALIGTLSRLAFSNHSNYKSDSTKEGWMYMSIIDHFVLEYNDTDEKDIVLNRKGLSDVIYRNIRCGLIHGGSLVSIGKKGKLQNEQVKIVLSHVRKDSRDFKTLDKEIIGLQNDTAKQLEITIGAEAMYDAIDKIIHGMFQTADSEVLKSIRETYREAPFVVAFKN